MKHSQHVLVVGGGLIGLCTAYALLRDGHTVTIVERATLGSGAAQGNAGEVTPLQVTPLASPNTVKDIVAGVLTKSSYLSIAKRQLLGLSGFGLGFIRSAGKARTAAALKAFGQLADGIFPSLDSMTADGIDTSGGGEGFLFTATSLIELEAAYASFTSRASAAANNLPNPIMLDDELHQFEPTLADTVRGGFLLPAERYLSPMKFVASLIRYVTANGATVHEHTPVRRLTEAGQRPGVIVSGQDGTEQTLNADAVVIAAGAWTSAILTGTRTTVKVVSGKGYSFTVPVERMPNTLIHSVDRHCVFTPMDGALRVVGMMEFDGRPEQLNADRISYLIRAATGVLTGAHWVERTDEWVGPRPMTADGLPAIGPVRGRQATYVATGHNMHGLSLGPITGDLVAQLVAGDPATVNGRAIDLAPFSATRS
ncbi:NAD(P)/FAD-dependent oxidoreductase [Lysinibacter cavernae]|uniref:D-amino-acid dehydrogenase n=1 Tax=Lysinibacter cavernae TaxID=1640652 RepID=A0A7X5TRY4_9MICO|nr:FAD-dependent oxidoreductase [Lysinibacter cavernae]NIH52225.1 D-amino-acid dehydrogenase [Lysinibacter cavernae]